MPRHHTLLASADTVHWGYFDATLNPVLTVESGDTVTLTTISGGPELHPKPGNGSKSYPSMPRSSRDTFTDRGPIS
jgi:acetamidase/formamidase